MNRKSLSQTLIGLSLVVLIMSAQEKETTQERVAIFSGGCFWCIEAAFEMMDGVIDVRSGFSGGELKNPQYKDVRAGKTDQIQAIQVRYNPSKVSYEQLLDMYWNNIDPTDPDGQYNDRGSQYRTAIYYSNQEQRMKALKSKQILEDSDIYAQNIVTMILPAKPFYPAEEYHQNYFAKHSIQYTTCRQNSPGPLKPQNNSNDL